MSTMTDEEIDRIEGRELDEAIYLSQGWTVHFCNTLKHPTINIVVDRSELKDYHINLGAAMGLLLTADDFPLIRIDRNADLEIVVYCHFFGDAWPTRIAGGPKLNAASIFCRAFLKLNGRKG